MESRRAFLARGIRGAAAIAALSAAPWAFAGEPPRGSEERMEASRISPPGPQWRRELSLRNLHTGEFARVAYREGGLPLSGELKRIDWLLRDHRAGKATSMDIRLLDLLARIEAELGGKVVFEVISGYRSPETNRLLSASARGDGVAKKSLHMSGQAIDIRVPGIPLSKVAKAALRLGAGGVGYYPKSDFVHVDVGPKRAWGIEALRA